MLANYTWNDAADSLLISLATNESLTVSESSGNVSFALSTGAFTQSGGNTASGNGTATITLAAAELAKSVEFNNSADTAGNNDVTFSGAGSLISESIEVNLGATHQAAIGTITFSGGFDISSTNAIILSTARNIAIGSGSVISASGAGSITMQANRQSTPTSGNFIGIVISGGTIATSGIGNILLKGRGGDTSNSNRGIEMRNGGKVYSTATGPNAGTITLDGIGGNGRVFNDGVLINGIDTLVTSVAGDIEIIGESHGSSGSRNGVDISNSTVSSTGIGPNAAKITINGVSIDGTISNVGVRIGSRSTQVTSVDGDIQITGQGGNGSSGGNIGVWIYNGGKVSSTGVGTGAATITIDGTAGNGATDDVGVVIFGTDALVTSAFGDIHILGKGGNNSGYQNYGVRLSDRGRVSSTGIGAHAARITIEGVGGGGTERDFGVHIYDADTLVTSIDGDIEVIATAGANTTAAFELFSNSKIQTTGTGEVVVTADGIDLATGTSINAGNNSVTLKTKSTDGSIGINLGGTDTFGTLGLTDAELDRITADKIIVGDSETPNTVTISAAIQHVGDADFDVFTARNIVFNGGSGWTTTNGDLDFVANRQPIATTGDFVGIALAAARLTTHGTGHILLEGRGGNAELYGYGISVLSGSIIQSTLEVNGAGTIDVDGIGGSGSFDNVGVMIGDAETEITSIVGDITITGCGGGDGAGGTNYGVGIGNRAIVSSTGRRIYAAKIAVNGVGGLGSDDNFGTFIFGFGQVTSVDGDIAIFGLAGGNASSSSNTVLNIGVLFFNSATVSSTGTAAIEVTGTGGTGIDSNFGVTFNGGAPMLTSVDGPITITAIAGENTQFALNLGGKSNLGSMGSATITLIADSMRIAENSVIYAADSIVTLQPQTPARSIDLGGAESGAELGLSDEELVHVSAAKLVIGDTATGKIDVTDEISRQTATNIELVSAADIIISGGQIDTAGGTLLLHPGTSPAAVKPIHADIDAVASTVWFGSNLAIAIDGTTVDSNYNQLQVSGTVEIAGIELVLSGSYVPNPGDVFKIVGATNVVGKFNGLSDGNTVTFNGVELVVRYTAKAVTLGLPLSAADINVLGAEAGARPRVKVLDARNGSVVASFLAYNAGFRGGVRVAVADLNGDGTAEIMAAPGAGMSTLVKVFDLGGHELKDYHTKAYKGFSGGVFIAAGDVNGDGRPDLITAPGSGLSSQIKVFKNRVGIASSNVDPMSNNPIYAFRSFGSAFQGGATVAAGDLTGDGRAEIVVGNGPGMGPRVRVFDLSLLSQPVPGTGINLGALAFEIRPFHSTDRGGVFVALGDVRGNATPEIIIGDGVNGRGRIEMYNANGSRFKSITAYDDREGNIAPVHVAAKNVDVDVLDEILTGQGAPGSIGHLRSFNSDGTLSDDVFEDEEDFRYGFFVA